MHISARLRQRVIQRAHDRCEYCGISQAAQEAAFHIDHIIPQTAAGKTILENLALACVSCSLRKGARLRAADPKTGTEVRLFNPRADAWRLHFRWNGIELVGISPIGHATIVALSLNRARTQRIRAQEIFHGRHPPPDHL